MAIEQHGERDASEPESIPSEQKHAELSHSVFDDDVDFDGSWDACLWDSY